MDSKEKGEPGNIDVKKHQNNKMVVDPNEVLILGLLSDPRVHQGRFLPLNGQSPFPWYFGVAREKQKGKAP